jgi:exodeoxyribonuclease VII large subunit
VTSRGGAVISDLIHILSRRFPGLHVRVFPAQVQGPGSIEEVSRGIQYFSRSPWAEVVIVARGGGSLEDLWTFNEEAVARAIVASAPPVISAIGHETDFTIADFVADLRAPTPSAAAELVVRTREEILDQIASLRHRLIQLMRYRIAMAWSRSRQQGVDRGRSLLHRAIGRRLQRIDELQYRLRERIRAALDSRLRATQALTARLRYYDPRPRLGRDRSRHESARAELVQSIRLQLSRRRRRLDSLEAKLSQLSPLAILNRGYAIVTGEDGHILMEAAAAPEGSAIDVRLARGRLHAKVRDSRP